MIRRLAPGDERVLQDVCRRFKSRVPSDDEATRALSLDDGDPEHELLYRWRQP